MTTPHTPDGNSGQDSSPHERGDGAPRSDEPRAEQPKATTFRDLFGNTRFAPLAKKLDGMVDETDRQAAEEKARINALPQPRRFFAKARRRFVNTFLNGLTF